MDEIKKKRVILLKLGGGLIAPKNWLPETADLETVKRLVKEIEFSAKRVVIAVGSGNFGHKAVKKYGIGKVEGVREVRKIARKIGRIVAEQIDNSILLTPHKMWRRGVDASYQIEKVLGKGLTPVMYGDVIETDDEKWIIYSGEKCLRASLPKLIEGGWQVEKIIQVGREEGVWNENGEVIEEINSLNWQKIRNQVGDAEGVDMTGGMAHKVLESLEIANNYGIYTLITSGLVKGRLKRALAGRRVPGTTIRNPVPDGLKQG